MSPIYDALLAEGAHPDIRPCRRHDCTAEAVNGTGRCLVHVPAVPKSQLYIASPNMPGGIPCAV